MAMKVEGGNLKFPKPEKSADVSPQKDKMALNKAERGGVMQKAPKYKGDDDSKYLRSSGGKGKGKKK